MIAAIVLANAASVLNSLHARKQQEKKAETETFTRPKPAYQIKPQIPSANRYQDDKVFLEKADSLFRPFSYDEEHQIVKGNVVFRQGGMWMYCDSAYYYPERNSLDAFGKVEMRQGDTLFVYSDKLFYDGARRHAVLTAGPSRREVTMKDPKMTLTTDSLDYDLNLELGWYARGGTLRDELNVLTSTYGEYSPATKQARFQQQVVLDNTKDGFRMYTDELDYNTDTHIADINSETRIEGENDTIYTSSGRYNTITDNAVLTARSLIVHRDSSMNVITLEGDSIIYDKATRISRAYMFADADKMPRPMVLTDTARKMTLYGGYGEYDDSLQKAFSTQYPLLVEYSRPDTLFLRADTILTEVRMEKVWPDSLSKPLSAAARTRLRGYQSLSDVAADLPVKLATLPYGFPAPGTPGALQGFISVSAFASAASKPASAMNQTPLPPAEPIEIIRRPTEGREEEAGESEETEGTEGAEKTEETNVTDVTDVTDVADSTVNADSAARAALPRLDKLGRDSNFMVDKEFKKAKAIGRARFFNQDMQGIADTLIYEEYDSMIYLIRKPIVWSEQRQIYGPKINVHLNDSTVDFALLPESGFMAEYIDEDFYNQLSGKKMKAFFEDGDLRRLEVDGNVETIFLPMENDSTYNRLVQAESSYLTIDLTDQKMDRLKMWPDVTGSVTPIFLSKPSQQYLRGFRWYEYLRPKREWYGSGWKWIDELGEVPEDIERYFADPTPAGKTINQ